MILPAWPTMPDFTAADPIIMSAFSPTALAGSPGWDADARTR